MSVGGTVSEKSLLTGESRFRDSLKSHKLGLPCQFRSSNTIFPSLYMSHQPANTSQLSMFQRLSLIFLSCFLLTGFGLAASVKPDPRGFGTHLQFGLPPCSFQIMFEVSCPSCGGTTCFAHFVRGQWLTAARLNPAVFAFAIICAITIPWSLFSSWKGQLWGIDDPSLFAVWLIVALGGFALLTWIFRILTT